MYDKYWTKTVRKEGAILCIAYADYSIPIMTYGLQVTQIKDADIARIDKTHHEVSKLIQGMSGQTLACASLITIQGGIRQKHILILYECYSYGKFYVILFYDS